MFSLFGGAPTVFCSQLFWNIYCIVNVPFFYLSKNCSPSRCKVDVVAERYSGRQFLQCRGAKKACLQLGIVVSNLGNSAKYADSAFLILCSAHCSNSCYYSVSTLGYAFLVLWEGQVLLMHKDWGGSFRNRNITKMFDSIVALTRLWGGILCFVLLETLN